MKHLFALCCGLALCTASFAQQPPADPWPEKLVGRWESAMGAGTYTEEWRKVSDGTYEGVATMQQNGKTVSTERTRLTLFAGSWLYIAATGHGITCFVRTTESDGTWVFQNNEHDFPKRIGYTLKGDALSAYIDDGTDTGNRMDFQLIRVE